MVDTPSLVVPRRRAPGRLRRFLEQAARFVALAVGGLVVYIGLYLLLRLFLPTLLANLIAWLISTLATNAVQRRVAFRVRSDDHPASDAIVGLVTSGLTLVASTLVLWLVAGSSATAQFFALVGVNAGVGAARFLFLRLWFRRREHR